MDRDAAQRGSALTLCELGGSFSGGCVRIVVWNCFRGDPSKRLEELSTLQPDVVVLPESRAPEEESDRLVWSGRAGEIGTAVLTTGSYRVVRAPLVPDASPSAAPFHIRGPVSFNLLAVWTFKEPTYAHGLSRVIDAYGPFMRSGPTVVAGDFNGNAIWDKDNKKVNYSVNARRLEAECGLKSAYHAHTGEAPGAECGAQHQWATGGQAAPTLRRESPFTDDHGAAAERRPLSSD